MNPSEKNSSPVDRLAAGFSTGLVMVGGTLVCAGLSSGTIWVAAELAANKLPQIDNLAPIQWLILFAHIGGWIASAYFNMNAAEQAYWNIVK